MKKLPSMLALMLWLCLAAPAFAGPLEDGLAAYEQKDYATALRLWRPFAEQGNADAQYNLGVMYDKGKGVPQDYVQAVAWYRKAADRGNAIAQYNLGNRYDNGKGVPQDYVQAVPWYRKAADQGYAWGQRNLGVMYTNGQGVPQDYVQAHKWFNLAAAAGSAPEGAENRGKLATENRDIVAAKMTPAQIAEAQRLAAQWKAR